MTSAAVRGRSWLLGAAAAAIVAVHALSFGLCLHNDAFVGVLRAQELTSRAGGAGAPGAWMGGESGLWSALCVVPLAAGVDPLGFLRGLGVLSAIGAVLAAGFGARVLAPAQSGAPGSASLLAAALPSLAVFSAMGLEAAAFAAALVFGAALAVREEWSIPRRARWPWSGVALALAALVRPEGALVAGLLFVVDAASCGRARRLDGRRAARWASFCAVVAAFQLLPAARFRGFASWTRGAGQAAGLAEFARRGARTVDFAVAVFPLLLLALVGCWALFHDRPRGTRAGAGFLLAATILSGVLAPLLGRDDEPALRSFTPAALFLAAFAAIGLEWLAGRRPWSALRRAGLLVTFAGLLFALGGPVRESAWWRQEEVGFERIAGRWLRGAFPAQTVIAASRAGALAYASGLPVIDTADGPGAAAARERRAPPVLDRRPRVILFELSRFSETPLAPRQAGRPLWPTEKELWADKRFHAEYALRSTRLPGFCLNYFERTAVP